MFRRILVPTDGSELSQKAVGSAMAEASTHGAELVVLHVVPNYPVSYFEGGISVSPDEVARTEKQWAEQGQALVEAVRVQAAEAGVRSTGVVVHSDFVAEAVIAAAGKHDCDLIVMASHGRKGVKRVLLGSETLNVLTHSTLPVLVLR